MASGALNLKAGLLGARARTLRARLRPRTLLAFVRSRPGVEKCAWLAWATFVVLPALLSAVRPKIARNDSVELVSGVLGAEVGKYLGYAPAPLVAYVIAVLAFTPLVALLISIGEAQPSRQPIFLLCRTYAMWLLLHAVSLAGLVVAMLVTAKHAAEPSATWGWTWRLAAALAVSGLAPAAIATAVAASVASPRRAIGLGFCLSVVVGLWGVSQWPASVAIAPGAIDRALLSGNAGVPWVAVLCAVGWVCLGVVVGTASYRIRGQRRVRQSVHPKVPIEQRHVPPRRRGRRVHAAERVKR